MTKSARDVVVVGVTGSVAAYKACEVVRLLKKEAFDVKVIMTQEAKRFIAPLTFQALSGNKVITDMFEAPDEWNAAHVSAADEAKVVVIAPATANCIGKLAGGICDDMLTCTVCATRAPILIAPAMNKHMYQHRIVQDNIFKLKKIGYRFIGPIKGKLACGYEGIGHIADVDDIVRQVKKLAR